MSLSHFGLTLRNPAATTGNTLFVPPHTLNVTLSHLSSVSISTEYSLDLYYMPSPNQLIPDCETNYWKPDRTSLTLLLNNKDDI